MREVHVTQPPPELAAQVEALWIENERLRQLPPVVAALDLANEVAILKTEMKQLQSHVESLISRSDGLHRELEALRDRKCPSYGK